mmetsp:Transcript_25083/g.46036  ORF Transcript_25083/g.46036 Transcript_25083/m.46036 type:complete len:339 (-) Transcript_25083:85-1101(-)
MAGLEGAICEASRDDDKCKASAVNESDLFDLDAFPTFSPLLTACKGYARKTGCRFRASQFPGLLEEAGCAQASSDEGSSRPSGPPAQSDSDLASRLEVLPVVKSFAARLHAKEAALLEELERASDIVMAESVRNAMIAAFQTIDLWPPVPKPPGVDDEDCCYEDVFADITLIAQRAYNSEIRRAGQKDLARRARTSSWLVDFADEVGYGSLPMSSTQQTMLHEFANRLQDWEEKQQTKSTVRDVFLRGLGAGAAADKLRAEASEWWSVAENRRTAYWTAAGLVTIGPVATGMALWARHAWQKRKDRLAEEASKEQASSGQQNSCNELATDAGVAQATQ